MREQINRILNIFIGSFIGVFIGHAVYVYWDYLTHPDLYVIQSAPWYTSILLHGIFTIILLAAVILMKLIFQKKIRFKHKY